MVADFHSFYVGLALENVDKIFAPEGLMDAVIDSKVPDIEAIEVRGEK